MGLRYADADALADYSPTLDHPNDVDTYLRAASALVARATRLARYATDAVGLPTDAELVGALSDATCEQVTAWTLAGVHPQRGLVTAAAEAGLTSSTVTAGPRTVTEQYTAGADESGSVVVSIDELTGPAYSILRDAGLTWAQPYAYRGAW